MSNVEDFFTKLLEKKGKKKEVTLIDKLYERPKKDKGLEATTFSYPNPGYYDYADVLFLPNDKGYIYCLVVVDQGNRLVDAEPLKNKTSETVLEAFKAIYKRDIIKKPKIVTTDAGKEFMGNTKQV